MRGVGGRRRQHELGVGGELDLAGSGAEVREGHAADLGVVLGGDDDLERASSIEPSRREISDAVLGEATS